MSKSTKITGVSDDPLAPDQTLPTSGAPIDIGSMAQFGKMGCIKREVAEFYGISVSTLSKFLHENPAINEAYQRGFAHRQVSLRHRQTQIALDDRRGNQQVAMLIWLGKQDPSQGGLGQQESFKLKGDPDNPLEVSVSSASELLAARIAQLVQRAAQTEQINAIDIGPTKGSTLRLEIGPEPVLSDTLPSGKTSSASLRREIEAAQKPDG